MTKVHYGYRVLSDVSPSTLSYSILVDEISFMGGQLLCEYYGVAVETEGHMAEVRYVTTNQGAITELLELLKSSMVTPLGLENVVEEWLS